MATDNNNVRMRSIYASSIPEDAEAQTRVYIDGSGSPPTAADATADRINDNDDDDKGHVDTLELPPSTHTLLFTQPVCSFPFIFSMGIVLLSYACLFLAWWNNINLHDQENPFNIPVNVSIEVRAAQYLAIFIALLMEEEIPTGLYLLRMIPRAAFQQKFAGKSYRKFLLSCGIRICMGYLFLLNVIIVLFQSTGVIEIFYDVLALQFVQQLDDIAFTVAKMDVLGKQMKRACTAKCFQTEFERNKFGRNKKMSIFLKAVYFLNLGALLAGMAVVSTKQIRGDYQCNSITVDLGNAVWEEALVKMPNEQFEKWVWLYPFFNDSVTPDEYETWTLVFSNFNGVYEQNGTHAGRPVYKEMRKFDGTHYELIVPAEIKYCKGISAWVLTHEHIQKSKATDQSGCNWLLRSQETTEYDLMNVDMSWKIWMGVIGNTEVSYACNRCSDETDCNLNGQCVNGECKCNKEDGVQYLGTRCEVKLKDSCQTIIGEADNSTYHVSYYSSAPNYDGPPDTLLQQYSRPVYTYVSGNSVFAEDVIISLLYTGNRWFIVGFSLADLNWTWDSQLISIGESHAFWGKDYDPLFTKYVSDETKKDTPVGVDFYYILERGGQFGPFGALWPISEQPGRGYFRCGGPISSLGNLSASDRKLQLQSIQMNKRLFKP